MAGAGQPFYTPLLWPVAHLVKMTTIDPIKNINNNPPKPVADAQLDFIGNLTSAAGAIRAFLMAYFCIEFLYDNNSTTPNNQYPAFRDNLQLFTTDLNSNSWIFPILLRNIVGTVVICGFWDYILYFNSYFSKKLMAYKFNPVYPSMAQIKHDVFYTLLSSIFAGIIEIFLCYFWSNGYISYQRRLLDSPISNALWIITITHWRIPHFYLIHRMMHPWKLTVFERYNIQDFGKFLYKHVHSLHHKSYNPTAFSGTNMHPVESTLYYSACLICVPFGCHPSIALACMVDCAVGAWLGHDGFQWPGSGDYFHQLHHMHFDCNYGALHVPLDKWFGTYIGDKNDLKKIWKKKSTSVGMEANKKIREVHPAGKRMAPVAG